MAVALRLNRQGTKDRPYYKIVAVDQRKRRDGRYIEQLGTYNPLAEGENFTIDLAKAEHWLHHSGKKTRKPMKRYARQARRYAEDAGDFARDHAREGGALLAVATIAAAIGAAALESRRKSQGSGGFGKL